MDVARYHYLGYTPLAGAQLRYFITSAGQILGAFGGNSAAWQVAPRDHWIAGRGPNGPPGCPGW